jgi:hypothetical protein
MSQEDTICCAFRPQSLAISMARQWRQSDKPVRSPTEKKMTKNNAAQPNDNARRDEPNLDSRYGQIGISAVAAALPYQSEVKNPAYAPVVHRLDEWIAEKAA